MSSQAITGFAIDLYDRLALPSAGVNVFCSPLSVSIVLGMAFEGARGRTAQEMGQVLGFGTNATREAVHSEMRSLLAAVQVVSELNGLLPQVELRLAGALWGARGCPFRREFVEAVREHYGKTAIDTSCDFANDPESERQRINRWVAEHTDGRIENLLSAGALDPLTRLVLTSAVYFRGEWATPFPELDTRDGEFTRIEGATAQIPMMLNWHDPVRYAAFNPDGTPFETPRTVARDDLTPDGKYPGEGGWLVLEKPYRGNQISMTVILPMAVDGIGALEKRLSAEELDSWTRMMEDREVTVTLPRFRVEKTYHLNDALAALGMGSAFEQPTGDEGADFGGMSESPDPINQLSIGFVIHKAFVEVNEKGTEAAAATGLGLIGMSRSEMADFIPEFRADHPFLFLIRHRETGSLLFLGRFANPAA